MSVVPWNQLDPAESPYVKLFGLVGIPFAAGIINFVVLTAAASSCNSGIFANSRTLFGLAGRKQGPPFLHKTNKHGVPYYAILLTCGLLSIAIILNAVFKDATKVFVQITTFSTVLNIMIWTCIMIAYLGFVKRNLNYTKIVNLKCLVANTWHMPFLPSLHLSLSFYLLIVRHVLQYYSHQFGQWYLSSCIKSIEKNLKSDNRYGR